MNSSSFFFGAAVAGLVAATFTTSLMAQEVPAKPASPAADKGDVGVSSRDGITVSGGEALITRNGRTEKLTKEFALPNGLRVQPDGRVLGKDGATFNLRVDQLLTFDGTIVAAPASGVIPPVRPATPPPATPPGTAVPYFTPMPVTPRPHIKAGEGVQK
jgi:hypothetical protein